MFYHVAICVLPKNETQTRNFQKKGEKWASPRNLWASLWISTSVCAICVICAICGSVFYYHRFYLVRFFLDPLENPKLANAQPSNFVEKFIGWCRLKRDSMGLIFSKILKKIFVLSKTKLLMIIFASWWRKHHHDLLKNVFDSGLSCHRPFFCCCRRPK